MFGLFGDEGGKHLRAFKRVVTDINAKEAEISALSDDDLRAQTATFKERIANGETLEGLTVDAFAVIREAAKRTLGERHFDVQLLGGLALHNGMIAEMRTGEGKTLVATLPAYLNALTGKGVHVVTVNDYLSRRDAVWMGQIYAFLGLSVGVINSQESFLYDPGHVDVDKERDTEGSFKVFYEFLRPCERKEAYAADITYGTNNEFGFDYLRDNIEYRKGDLRQREYAYAIVDEIDSILIDEARTPLIISAPSEDADSFYIQFAKIATQLEKDKDFTVDEKHKQIALTDDGIEKAEKILGIENIYTDRGIKYVHHLETAVRAKALFQKDKEYVVRDGNVVIVDEFTGRMQPGRRWSEGLHQAIEAKEGVTIQQESRTYASVTFQNYFRMYTKLSGMTGTAKTSSEEFFKVYGLNVLEIPTNKKPARIDHNDLIFQNEHGKFVALARRVKELNQKGQPVLIGTVSIEKNELLSAHLQKEGVPHELLNAKNHEREGEIIAQAGRKGGVTIATNMAGRGVDIKLGGATASKEEYEEVKALGGLFVMGTERHEARRIDNQLRGRAGRQGDPGATQFFVSLEDSLMRIFAYDTIKGMMGRFGIKEDEPIENRLITRSLETAQTKIEGFNFDARKAILSYDDVLDRQRASLYTQRRTILTGTDEEVKEILAEITADISEAKEVIEKKEQELGEGVFYASIRPALLQTMDLLWMEHLETMDYLRSSVNLRAYGQRDPLIEYRKEGLKLFKELEHSLSFQIIALIPNLRVTPVAAPQQEDVIAVHGNAEDVGERKPTPSKMTQQKIGRNEMVTITNGSEQKEMKYKKAEPLIKSGAWRLV